MLLNVEHEAQIRLYIHFWGWFLSYLDGKNFFRFVHRCLDRCRNGPNGLKAGYWFEFCTIGGGGGGRTQVLMTGFKVLIAPVPDHCLSFYLSLKRLI